MADRWTVPATVVEVIDGDTVRLDLDLGWHITIRTRVRVAGINAPEVREMAGIRARQYAQALLQPGDKVMFLSSALDKYGRPLGHIVHDGANFGTQMVDAGHAVYVKEN